MNRSTRFRNGKPASISIRTDKYTSMAVNNAQKEALEDLVQRENDFLEAVRDFSVKAEDLRARQLLVLKGRTKLEDRMIGILTFVTSIELYRRFLEERYMNASQQLAEQVDDLGSYQEFIELNEKSVEQCSSMLQSDVNDQIEAENFEEQLAVDTLISQNSARSMILRIKQQLMAKPSQITSEKPIEISHKSLFDALPDDGEMDLAKLELEKSQELFDKTQTRQQKLNSIHNELEQLENDFHMKIHNSADKYRIKANRIENLRNNLFDIEKMQLDINTMNENNARLKTTLCEALDGDAGIRRDHAIYKRKQDKIDADKCDINFIKNRYEDRRKYAKKRRHIYKKREQEVSVLQAEVDEAEAICCQKIQEVLDLEKQEHEMEVKLNNKLKEIQNIMIQSNEEASFENSCTPVSQVGELQKIITLVSNNENIMLN
ncbi:hypothetical protein TRFO_14666 [Tritrichomonas foetus]|uniref:Uncharacterized protein n=1 Tax=Tritrichomonas foetus TaxID=1144522 RepID=A0A1J4KUD7_9EUKA|nr:hypothetical protein TRFO_14666 [Tritrichomonas foetus]|eukprot:OHT14883.1 hypothetical protein TRFO_14666 [Tritrichomonas foetus]